jgi:DNA polymerase III subunit delta
MAKKVNTHSASSIISDIRAGKYASVYGLHGEEPYYIDLISDVIEKEVLKEEEKDFNLTIMYGKDSTWADVVNACRRYPVFADKQVVLLKEAQTMKDISELQVYLENPLESTIFVIAHKYKKFDGRTAFPKTIDKKGILFSSDILREYEMPTWIRTHLSSKNIKANEQVINTLVAYLGTDLQRIVNEIDKVLINAPAANELTPELIEKYIGISRDYNLIEWPDVILKQDKERTFKMLQYYLANPKEAPMPLVIGSFFAVYTRYYKYYYAANAGDAELAKLLGMSPFFVKDIRAAARIHSLEKIENALLIIQEFAEKGVGMHTQADGTSLLKEMISRLYYN